MGSVPGTNSCPFADVVTAVPSQAAACDTEGRREFKTTKGTADTNPPTRAGSRGIKKTDKEQLFGKSNRNDGRLFRNSSSDE